MANVDRYIETIDTIYPDAYARESVFRDAGEMLSPAPFRKAGGMMARLIERFSLWQQKRNTRAALRELTVDELRDIGLTREQALGEAAKSYFWD